MRHYTQDTYKKGGNDQTTLMAKTAVIASVASLLLDYLQYFNVIVPYSHWKKDKKAIGYLTEPEYELAKKLAIKQACDEASVVFKHLEIRKKIED